MRVSRIWFAFAIAAFLASTPVAAFDDLMNTYTGQVTIATGSTPTLIAAARPGRARITIEQLTSTADIYCGSVLNAPVSTTNGMLIPAGKGTNIVMYGGSAIYCVVVGSTAVAVSYTEEF